MLYYLVPAMYPRFMITLDEDLKSLPVTVRVGQVRYGFTSLVLDRCSIKLDRLLRLSVKQESHGRFQDSKHTHRPYG
jgi:hypothetical protein